MGLLSLLLATASVTLLPSAVTSWSCGSSGSATFALLKRFAISDELAVCNDGTQSSYYYTAATTQKETWFLYLSGGGQCFDAQSCQKRYEGSAYPGVGCETSTEERPCFMSSKDFAEDCPKTGVFDTDPELTPVSGAHKIYVPYCSSDAWMGDVSAHDAAENSGIPFAFRGQRIVRATVAALVAEHGLGSSGGHERLIFAGGSAGGRGAMALADFVQALVPASVEVLGYFDSAYYLSQPAPLSDYGGFDALTAESFINFRSEGLVPDDCGAAYPDEPWRCMFGQYRAPFVRVRHMLVASQFDAWQLSHTVHNVDGIEEMNFTDAELPYVYSFGGSTAQHISLLPSRHAAFGSAVFSSACYTHHDSEKVNFWVTAAQDGTTLSEALGAFLNGSEQQMYRWVDDPSGGIDSAGLCGSAV